jgi:RNA polymerase sigma-70 factor (ECF subfamily)
MTPESFAAAYAKGFRLTVRFLLSKGASFDQAEEVAQTAWTRGWEARAQLLLEDRVLPWVNSIAYHRLCNDHRQSARTSELNEIADARVSSSANRVDAAILLNRCSELDRELMVQRYIEGKEMKEIAASEGLSEIAVRVRIHRCQHNLRSSLRKPNEEVRGQVTTMPARDLQPERVNAEAGPQSLAA